MGKENVKLSLKRLEPVLDPDDPWFDDKLERRVYAPVLTSLVGDSHEPLVVALNGGWGTGKTFFLQRWGRGFEEPVPGKVSGRVIYFSAWQDDDIDDPLLAIVGQLHRNLHAQPLKVDENVKVSVDTKAAQFLQTANRVLSNLGKFADSFTEHWTGVKPVEVLKDFSNRMAQRVDMYSEGIEARVDLKKRLRDLANEIYMESGKPLVFVIDDLDRCKPSFAIATLERIKHLFDVQHIVFILGIDLQQFGKTLKNVYGDLDVANYLNRLVDIEFSLPDPSIGAFIDYLWDDFRIEQYFSGNESEERLLTASSEFKDVISFLAQKFSMTLRDMERATREFVAVEKSISFTNAREATLLALLCAMRLSRPKIYSDFVGASSSASDIAKCILGDFSTLEKGVRGHIQEIIFASYKHADQKDVGRVHEMVSLLFNPIASVVDERTQRSREMFEASILDSPINKTHLLRMQKLLACFTAKTEEDF